MSYDSQHDLVIMYGGYGAAENDETWVYDFDSNIWTRKYPSSKPPALNEHAIAYDSESDRTILFGGSGGGSTWGETWAYDLIANIWINMNPATKPAARSRHCMAYDSQSDRIILFGGDRGSDETWSYDFNNNKWTEMFPTSTPSPRSRCAMAYDSYNDRIVMFGGEPLGGGRLGDTVVYDYETNNWTGMTTATQPVSRIGHSRAYDSRSGRVILFGGEDGLNLRDDTWMYDYGNNTWTDLTRSAKPSDRAFASMAYDSQSDRVILFGGGTLTGQNQETWAHELSPPDVPSAPEYLVVVLATVIMVATVLRYRMMG